MLYVNIRAYLPPDELPLSFHNRNELGRMRNDIFFEPEEGLDWYSSSEEDDTVTGNCVRGIRASCRQRGASQKSSTMQSVQSEVQDFETLNDFPRSVDRRNEKGAGMVQYFPLIPGLNRSMFYNGTIFNHFLGTQDAHMQPMSYLHAGGA